MVSTIDNYCKQCGKCCKAIISVRSASTYLEQHPELQAKIDAYNKGELSMEEVAKDEGLFAVINFKPITKEEATKVNPHIASLWDDGQTFFHECRQAGEDGRCKIHEQPRAGFCHNHPLYNITFREYVHMPYMDWYVPDCGYAQKWEADKARMLEIEQQEKENGTLKIFGEREDKDKYCKRCGACCAVIVESYPIDHFMATHPEIKEVVDDYRAGKMSDDHLSLHDNAFKIVNFTEISETEAFKRNPHLAEMGLSNSTHYYTCRYYDPESKLCPLHEKGIKPRFCRDYPVFGYQGRPISEEIEAREDMYIPTCGIFEELERRYYGQMNNGADN